MSESTDHPNRAPENDSPATREPGAGRSFRLAVIVVLWLATLCGVAFKIRAWVFVAAPDLLAVFVAIGLAVAAVRRMRRRASLWAIWSFVLPPVALVLSQFRRSGSESQLRKGRLIVRTAIVLALVVGCFALSSFCRYSATATDAMGKSQEYLLTTIGYYAYYEKGSVRVELDMERDGMETVAAARLIVFPAFPAVADVLAMSLLMAACLYRSGSFIIVSMAVVGLVVGLGGDVLGMLIYNLGALRVIADRSSILGLVMQNHGLFVIFQMLIVYVLAARAAWETVCEEYPKEEQTHVA